MAVAWAKRKDDEKTNDPRRLWRRQQTNTHTHLYWCCVHESNQSVPVRLCDITWISHFSAAAATLCLRASKSSSTHKLHLPLNGILHESKFGSSLRVSQHRMTDWYECYMRDVPAVNQMRSLDWMTMNPMLKAKRRMPTPFHSLYINVFSARPHRLTGRRV